MSHSSVYHSGCLVEPRRLATGRIAQTPTSQPIVINTYAGSAPLSVHKLPQGWLLWAKLHLPFTLFDHSYS
jgi:hypothetical protein